MGKEGIESEGETWMKLPSAGWYKAEKLTEIGESLAESDNSKQVKAGLMLVSAVAGGRGAVFAAKIMRNHAAEVVGLNFAGPSEN